MNTSLAASQSAFAPGNTRHLLALAGIGLVLLGIIFGDIFAVFILHQNAARVGESLAGAAQSAMVGDASGVATNFTHAGESLENRGTKVDTHVHLIGFGYLALILAILQPWMILTE